MIIGRIFRMTAMFAGRTRWLSGMLGALRPDGRRLEPHSSRHVGTLSKSFTYSYM